MVKVVVAGVGTIGKRVAEAVRKQEDMKLYGLADVSQTGGLKTVLSEEGSLTGTHLFASNEEGKENLEEAGFYVEGLLEEQLDDIDVVVDCTPPGVDKANKENMYEPHDVKAIFQGGAPDDIAEVKFNASANYEEAEAEDFVKIVSCNTTSLSRTLSKIDEEFGIKNVTANLVRRGGDIPQDGRGPINSTIPVTDVPSHHAADVQAVMPDLDITTLAVKVPVTFGHVHMVTADIEEDTTKEEALKAFKDQERVRILHGGEGYDSTGKVHEQMRDLKRPRSDMPEAGVWKETIMAEDGKLRWLHMVHQESIVVPDNVDAIRAIFNMESKEKSIQKTNEAMNIE